MRVPSYLPLPKKLKTKCGCINIENDDEKCFLWSILASLHSVQCRNHLDRVSKYQKFEHELNMFGIQYLVDKKILGKLNFKTTLVLMSMGTKINNLPVMYCHHDHCKTSGKLTIYHC